MNSLKIPFEIILQEEGSTDGTGEFIIKLVGRYKEVKSLSFPGIRKGKGWGFKQCLKHSKGDIILLLDADLSSGINVIDKLVLEITNTDIVVGVRTGEIIVGGLKFYRILLSKIYRFLARIILGINVSDILCGFKAFHSYVFNGMTIDSDGFDFDTEILLKALQKGFRIKEVQVDYIDMRKSKVNPIADSFKFLIDLIKFRLKYGSLKPF